MRHYLLTRFNVALPDSSGINLQPAWLDPRIDLFRRFCLPAVEAQTTKDFTWLIMCDPETPDPQRQERLREVEEQNRLQRDRSRAIPPDWRNFRAESE